MIERTPPAYTQEHFYQVKCLSFLVVFHLIIQAAIIIFYIAYTAKMLVKYWEYGVGCGMVPPVIVWVMSYHALYLLSYPNTETVRKRKSPIICWYVISLAVLIAALAPSILAVNISKLYQISFIILISILSFNIAYTFTLGVLLFVLMKSIHNQKISVELMSERLV